jgi:hypothetical protein
VIDLFGDIVTEGGELPSPSDETDIGLALGRVLHEIDEIAIATLKSITLATLIKSIDWQQAHQTAQNQASI